jgi:hypothetical protein
VNARTKTAALTALYIAVVLLLIWQRRQITRLDQHNAELRARLGDIKRELPPEPAKPATAPDSNPELLRLRAEVANLRRQHTELTRSNSTPRVASTSATDTGAELPFEIREQQSTQVLKRLVLAMHMIIVDREEQKAGGKLEVVDANGALGSDIRRKCETLLKEGDETSGMDLDNALRDIEFLITDAADLRKLEPNTIVARSVPMKMPNGKWRRVYAFADGSAHRLVHDTPDEVWQAPAQ